MKSPKDYKTTDRHYNLREHIYEKPDTYIGSDSTILREELVFDLKSETLVQKKVTFPEGIENMFMELLTNASDNVLRSQEEGIPLKNIEIILSPYYVEVMNNGGLTIKIEKIETDKGFNGYIPELRFGELLTTTNSDHKGVKVEAGRNGYGAKVCNVFSTKFEVEIGDHINNKKYHQIWTDQMTEKGEPKIKVYRRKTPFVRVRHYLDFERFGYSRYPLEALELFISRGIFVSFSCNCKVVVRLKDFKLEEYFNIDEMDEIVYKSYENDEKVWRFNELSLPNFCELINSDCEKLFYYKYKVPENKETYLVSYSSSKKIKRGNLKIELCILDTPDKGIFYSFANGIYTKNGGIHVDEALYSIPKEILNMINKETKRKFNMNAVKSNISIVISCHLDNPRYSNQYKHSLNYPRISINVDPTKIKKMKNWSFSKRIYDRIQISNIKELKKTDGKKKKHVNVLKLQDANYAGHRSKSKKCTLFLSEGDSPASFLQTLISNIEGGRDYNGFNPLKGKFINILKAPNKKILESKEIIELKQILGLVDGVDYSKPKNFATLRYGKVVIVADADVDGKHIVGLVLTFFFKKYISLLDVGYFHYMRTPIISTTKGTGNKKKKLKFYTIQDYTNWCEDNSNYKTWHAKYYKGLGTSTEEDVIEEAKDPKFVKLKIDDLTEYTINVAFGKSDKISDKNNRKKWLYEMIKFDEIVDTNEMNISFFINREIGEFSMYNNKRGIVFLMDGLKPSTRKCIWGGMKKWNPSIGKKFSEKDEFKVCRLANYIAEVTNYSHGETSLSGAIVKMTQTHVGSNNMNVFYPAGRFGTRQKNGDDASNPRYLFTYPEWWWSYIFRNEDKGLLKLIEEEGEECEPETFFPIIPICLINGTLGMGTGWRTIIPNHNPIDLCNWLIATIKNETPPEIKPWYKGFKGEIVIENDFDTTIHQNDHDLQICLENSVNSVSNGGQKVITKGVFEILNTKKVTEKNKSILRYDIRITELPIGKSILKYETELKKFMENNEILDFNNRCTDNEIEFTIEGFSLEPNFKTLKLTETITLNDIHAHVEKYHVPIKLNNVEHYMKIFYSLRLPIYEQRKQNIIQNNLVKLKNLEDKINFIEKVRKDEITLRDSITVNNEKMREMNLPLELLKSTSANMFSKEKIDKLQNQMRNARDEINQLRNIEPKSMWLTEIEEFLEEYQKRLE